METQPLLLTLTHVTTISQDTKVFRFEFPDPQMSFHLQVCHHLVVQATIGDKKVKRKYTPVSDCEQIGFVDLLIKVYYPCAAFPEGGKMTQYIDGLKVGDTLEFARQPRGKITFTSPNLFTFHKLNNLQCTPRHIGLIAGGSGIAPVYQLIRHIHQHHDPVALSLLFANKTEADILLRVELEEIQRAGALQLWFTVDSPSEGWTMGRGYITKEMIREHLPPCAEDVVILICGNSPMNKMMKTHLAELGYSMVAKF